MFEVSIPGHPLVSENWLPEPYIGTGIRNNSGYLLLDTASYPSVVRLIESVPNLIYLTLSNRRWKFVAAVTSCPGRKKGRLSASMEPSGTVYYRLRRGRIGVLLFLLSLKVTYVRSYRGEKADDFARC